MELPNPCLRCGACCAHFRAGFYWAEADDATPGGVPVGLTFQGVGLLRYMVGTDRLPPRCVALEGEIGVAVRCSIYAHRASVCRDFEPSWISGHPNDRCDAARAAHGLSPLTPQDWGRDGSHPSNEPPLPRAA